MRTMGIWALALTTLIGSQSVSAADLPGKGSRYSRCKHHFRRDVPDAAGQQGAGKLGYDVKEPREVDYNVAYTSIASGDATLSRSTGIRCTPISTRPPAATPSSTAKASTSTAPRRGYLIDKKPPSSTTSPTSSS